MKTVAIVQARMTSSRLPGKVLADLDGAPMLERVVSRLRAASRVDAVWVACTDGRADDPVAEWCDGAGVPVWRGSETDVLGRYTGAAGASEADVIVRITADCPLLDPGVVDLVLAALADRGVDYATNVLERSYPRGLDVEAFTRAALERMDRLGHSAESREHVTLGPRLEHPESFTVTNVRGPDDDSDLRWTVDTAEDLAFVRSLYQALGLAARPLSYRDLVRWCRANEPWARRDRPGHTWDPARAGAGSPSGGGTP
ncbi:MAG: NTP transferase domain-containing protein [Gemmatimonadales bacterium]